MSQEHEPGFKEARPKEWERGQELGATTALEYTLTNPGAASSDDIVAVQELVNREHIGRQWGCTEEKAVKMGDIKGGAAFALGALEAICETLDREASTTR
jgi:hypothetical protein